MAGMTHDASLCVLASGSSGNCSVLRIETACGPRLIMIDAGLSPRRTRKALAEHGLGLENLEAILLTHLDRDHWHVGWMKALPSCLPLWVHKRHASWGRRREILPCSTQGFDGSFTLDHGALATAPLRIVSTLASHDELGVSTFRIELSTHRAGQVATLGFATDVGRMRDHLIEHLRNVDVLAIESNYCPHLQAASSRPWFLKRRITGGHGHLSNEEALEAVRTIGPSRHVVFLHLSRECNDPAIVASLHHGAPYEVTITSQTLPSPWIAIRPSARAPDQAVCTITNAPQLPLFGSAVAQSAGKAGAA